MSKKKTTKPEAENPEVEQSANIQPDYVKELLEKGVIVLSGRSPEELGEMLDNIPADCSYYAGCITKSYDTGLYRIQVNLNQFESN